MRQRRDAAATGGSAGPGEAFGERERTGPVRRNPEATRARILAAGIAEFSTHGYRGGRIERIAARAETNIRMIYHYFGGKEPLYVACLERIYLDIRTAEQALHLADLEPVKALGQLFDFTFDYLLEHPEFVRLISTENLERGQLLKQSQVVPHTTLPLLEAIRDILHRGERAGTFRTGVDPIQLYVSILSLCFVHNSNRYTLTAMFQTDLTDPDWLAARRAHAKEMLIGYLKA